MWGPTELAELVAAAKRYDHDAAGKLVDAFLSGLDVPPHPPEGDQKPVLDALRGSRFFDLMRKVGERLIAARVATPRTKRQCAQALIELGAFDDAVTILLALQRDASCPADELAEAGGLIGRAYKQVYVDQLGALGAARRSVIQSSIAAYYDVYESNPKAFTWQGINAVAMLLRSARDGIPVTMKRDPLDMAREILTTLLPKGDAPIAKEWDVATVAEAYVALGQWDEAAKYVAQYVVRSDVTSFGCASTLRQLRQVWQIKESDPEGALLTLLQHGLVRRSATEAQGAPLSLDVGQLRTAEQHAEARRGMLEKTFGDVGARTATWYKLMLSRAGAVGRVEKVAGRAYGSGFLVRATDFFTGASAEEFVFVTNSHVLGHLDPKALRPADAVVRFEELDARRTFEVGAVLFESPEAELDVTIVRLDAAVTGVEPYLLAPQEEPEFVEGDPRQYFVIGHPLGGELSIAIDDNLQVGWRSPRLHYRTPTEPGSSGSPVFDDAWRLVALHHAGSSKMPRLDGAGTYEANEGIWIHAIIDATRKQGTPAAVTGAPLAAKPVVRKSVFVSYAHADLAWLQRLEPHLKPLTDLVFWDDRRIAAGANWLSEIDQQLDQASVAILLVSARFLASEFITRNEFPRLLDASRQRGLRILPVAISTSNYQFIEPLRALQFANNPERPLDVLRKGSRERALADIAARVHALAAGQAC